jgi:hypothetical protein
MGHHKLDIETGFTVLICLIMLISVPSATQATDDGDCQARCSSNDKCRFWSFNGVTKRYVSAFNGFEEYNDFQHTVAHAEVRNYVINVYHDTDAPCWRRFKR